MHISIVYLSQLANLDLSDEQKKILEESVPAVIEHMEEIKHLDLSHVQQTNGVTEEENVYREDIVEPSLSQEEALKNGKSIYNGFFVVPYVFEEEIDVTE